MVWSRKKSLNDQSKYTIRSMEQCGGEVLCGIDRKWTLTRENLFSKFFLTRVLCFLEKSDTGVNFQEFFTKLFK